MRRFWGRANEKQGRGEESGEGTNGQRSRERRGMTLDPSTPMGQRELRWWDQCLLWRGGGEGGSGGESRAAAEGHTHCSRREGRTHCS